MSYFIYFNSQYWKTEMMSQPQPILSRSICCVVNEASAWPWDCEGMNHGQHKVPLTPELKLD